MIKMVSDYVRPENIPNMCHVQPLYFELLMFCLSRLYYIFSENLDHVFYFLVLVQILAQKTVEIY